MRKDAFRQWMYRGQRPNWLARALNRATVALASSRFGAKYGMVTLEVIGRTSGRTILLPVVVVVVDGQRYLVSMLGDNVQWVKNVRAASGRAVLHSGGNEEVHLEEIPVEQRAPILKAYLHRAPGARSHIPVNQDAPLAEFEKIAAAYPVFRLVSPRLVQAKPARLAAG
ncbi:MAG TPA: nitroreductase/quinone reductase family protein [Ktedonobacterales bacterium]